MAKSLSLTDFKDLGTIWTKKRQNRDPATSHKRPTFALDTETYHGNIFLIADSEGRFLDKISPQSVIKFLFHKKYESSWNFFYNLTYDAEVILKLLGSELFRYKNTKHLEFEFEEYKIQYYPAKCLKINKGHHTVLFYDISQFYHSSLQQAYENNIGKLDHDYIALKQKRNEFSSTFYRRNTTVIRNYCIQDCILTKELSEKWIMLFHNAFGFYPLKWVSSGYLAEKVLINHGIEIPKFDFIPYEIQDLALRSYFGGRFEILKRGFIGTAYLYDINSAYPYAITKIPDFTRGRWIKRKSIHKDAKVGFFKIRANIPDDKYIPPFPFRARNNILFPSGKFETYTTLPELQACEDSRYYEIIDSWQFIPESETCPYKDFIERLYRKRLELKVKNNPMQAPIKIILNSIYGKTGQKVNRVIGNLFNPVIFAFITGFARAQLYRFAIDNGLERDTVSFATDSICTTKKLDADSNQLGKFSFEGSANDVFYLQNGFYRFNGKWKQRGFGKLSGKEIEHLETFQKQGRLYYKIKLLRNTRLRTSIIQDQISEIGKIKTVVKKINLNADRKRFWLGKIESIDQKSYNDSLPLSLSYFNKDEI